jgi:hypothetical protein
LENGLEDAAGRSEKFHARFAGKIIVAGDEPGEAAGPGLGFGFHAVNKKARAAVRTGLRNVGELCPVASLEEFFVLLRGGRPGAGGMGLPIFLFAAIFGIVRSPDGF